MDATLTNASPSSDDLHGIAHSNCEMQRLLKAESTVGYNFGMSGLRASFFSPVNLNCNLTNGESQRKKWKTSGLPVNGARKSLFGAHLQQGINFLAFGNSPLAALSWYGLPTTDSQTNPTHRRAGLPTLVGHALPAPVAPHPFLNSPYSPPAQLPPPKPAPTPPQAPRTRATPARFSPDTRRSAPRTR